MKKLFVLLMILGFTSQLFSRWGEGTYLVFQEADYDKTLTVEYTKNYCFKGYNILKKYLKNEAKEFCAREFGTHGPKMFSFKEFTKKGCVKIKRRGHKTKVRVTGRFRAMCKKN